MSDIVITQPRPPAAIVVTTTAAPVVTAAQPRGLKGDTGATGPAGPDGPQGPAGTISDGDKGDVTVASGGTVWTVPDLAGKANTSHTHAISDTTGLQTALDGKAASSHSHAISDITGLQTALDGKAATSHSHATSDVTGLDTALAGKQPLATALTNTTAAFTTAQETKLSGIATGATANDTDANLRARSSHTGTQAASTISDFSEAVDDRVAALLVEGTNITLTYNDAAGSLTIDAAGGGSYVSPLWSQLA